MADNILNVAPCPKNKKNTYVLRLLVSNDKYDRKGKEVDGF